MNTTVGVDYIDGGFRDICIRPSGGVVSALAATMITAMTVQTDRSTWNNSNSKIRSSIMVDLHDDPQFAVDATRRSKRGP